MNILKKIILILMFVLSFSEILLSQEMTQEKKAEYIGYLSGKNYSTVMGMLKLLSDSNVVEAIPAMVSNLWRYEPSLRYECLMALYKLNFPGTHSLALAYYDSLSIGKTDRLFSKLKLQSWGNHVLFPLGDYSKRQYVLDYIRSVSPEVDKIEIYLLEEIVKHVPSESEVVKNELIKVALNSSNEMNRWIAARALKDHYGFGAIETIIKVFENDSEWSNRGLMISEIFTKYKNNEIHNSLLKQTKNEINDQNLFEISHELLGKYQLPADLLAVKAVYNQIVDTVFKKSIMYLVKDFIPRSLNFLSTRIENVDTLISYHSQCASFNWLGNTSFSEQLKSFLLEAKTKLISGDSLGAALKIKQYQSAIVLARKDSLADRFVTTDGYKFLYYYPKYILERLPKLPAVKLEDSHGSPLNGGSLQYYEGSWKDAINNYDGAFTVPTKLKTVSLRMNYAFGSQTKSNVTVGADTVIFQTRNTLVKLQNRSGAVIDTGKVQHYAGAWRDFGPTANGIASKELLPGNYSFRMTYAFASIDKAQDIGVNSTVVFQTVPTTVQLKNSLGNLIDVGTVQYYSGAWRDFGVTTNGVAIKELLPNNYSFRMNYAFAGLDKQQNIGTNPIVVFQTVSVSVQLKNSIGNPIDLGTVQYYSGAWRDFGTTTNGVAVKELLPINYSFRMNYAFASKDKAQDISVNPTVVFQTVNATVQLKNSLGNLIDPGTVQYYSGAWRDFGSTNNGIASLELLPNNYSFRMTHEFISMDKAQDIGKSSTVSFSTILCRVNVKNAQNQPVDNAGISYYSGAWRVIGNTLNGTITKELLPVNLQFRLNYGTVQQNKTQNLLTNSVIEFSL